MPIRKCFAKGTSMLNLRRTNRRIRRRHTPNGISGIHQAWLDDGGLGILLGDGMLPQQGPEGIVETYYSYALTALDTAPCR